MKTLKIALMIWCLVFFFSACSKAQNNEPITPAKVKLLGITLDTKPEDACKILGGTMAPDNGGQSCTSTRNGVDATLSSLNGAEKIWQITLPFAYLNLRGVELEDVSASLSKELGFSSSQWEAYGNNRTGEVYYYRYLGEGVELKLQRAVFGESLIITRIN